MLHAVPGEHAEPATVHVHRERYFENALRVAKIAVQRFVETDEPAHFVELMLSHLPNVLLRLNCRDILSHVLRSYPLLSRTIAERRTCWPGRPAGEDSSTSCRPR